MISSGGTTGGQVWWDISLVDGIADGDEHTARTLLDTYYYAPDYADGATGMTKCSPARASRSRRTSPGMVMQFDPTTADEATSGA